VRLSAGSSPNLEGASLATIATAIGATPALAEAADPILEMAAETSTAILVQRFDSASGLDRLLLMYQGSWRSAATDDGHFRVARRRGGALYTALDTLGRLRARGQGLSGYCHSPSNPVLHGKRIHEGGDHHARRTRVDLPRVSSTAKSEPFFA
jgi:hypothetical protein